MAKRASTVSSSIGCSTSAARAPSASRTATTATAMCRITRRRGIAPFLHSRAQDGRVALLTAEFDTGQRFGAYQLGKQLGRGGMGVVYQAQHVHLGRTVALKLLAPELSESEDFRARFLRESRLAATLDHPGIVTVYDAGDVDGVLYLAMRFVRGTDLAALLVQRGPLELAETLAILDQVAAALDAAHGAGLVHRDVKPANVM